MLNSIHQTVSLDLGFVLKQVLPTFEIDDADFLNCPPAVDQVKRDLTLSMITWPRIG
jgi:hypothetical protein